MAQTRWTTIQSYWTKEYTWLWLIPGVILGTIIGFLAGIASTADIDTWFIDGFWPELLGAAMTIVILERLVDYRSQLRETKRLKKRLIRELGSQSNETTKAAVDWMRAEGWLTVEDDIQLLKGIDLEQAGILVGSNLQGVNLVHANLQGANLFGAKLQGAFLNGANLQDANLRQTQLQGAWLSSANLKDADLWVANLKGAHLTDANLQNADLWWANLQGARLGDTNLQGANLTDANLQNANLKAANLKGADLLIANLQGANLQEANLRGANLQAAKFDEKTVLPDAKNIGGIVHNKFDKYYVEGETDMSRYTNPEHLEFWQPDWVKDKRNYTPQTRLSQTKKH